jgi:hypothetical protein
MSKNFFDTYDQYMERAAEVIEHLWVIKGHMVEPIDPIDKPQVYAIVKGEKKDWNRIGVVFHTNRQLNHVIEYFPLAILYSDNWKILVETIVKREEEEKQSAEGALNKIMEDRERKLYEKLKKKFEANEI